MTDATEGAYDNHLPDTAREELLREIEAIERIEEERRALGDDVRDKLALLKGKGFDTKAVRKVIALRKKSREEREEEDAITAVYLHALGMLDEVDMEAAAQPMAKRTTRRTPLKKRKGPEGERTPANGYQPDN